MAFTPGEPTKNVLDTLANQAERARSERLPSIFKAVIIPAYAVLAAAELRTTERSLQPWAETEADRFLKIRTSDRMAQMYHMENSLRGDIRIVGLGDIALTEAACEVLEDNLPPEFAGIREVIRRCGIHEKEMISLGETAVEPFELQAVKL